MPSAFFIALSFLPLLIISPLSLLSFLLCPHQLVGSLITMHMCLRLNEWKYYLYAIWWCVPAVKYHSSLPQLA